MKFEQLKPTSLVPRGGVLKPNVIPPSNAKFRNIGTLWRLISFCFAILWLVLRGKGNPDAYGKRARRMFEDIGYLWIRAGQLFSLRTDIFSPEVCRELNKVQNYPMAFPSGISLKIAAENLPGPLHEHFDEFQEQPFATMFIAQIHRAHLKRENIWVAVKVMRPDALAVYARDMKFFRYIVKTLARFKIASHLRLEEAIWELDQIAKEETDYRYELTNTRLMRRKLKKHGILVPKPIKRYCNQRVLVTEYITGVLFSAYIETSESEIEKVRKWEIENNVIPERVAKKLYSSFFRQLFEDNIVHGDLASGNIVLLKNSKIAFINFGSVERGEAHMVQRLRSIAKSIAANELEKTAELFLDLSPSFPVVDVNVVKQDMVRSLRAWYLRTPVKNLEYGEKSITAVLNDLLKIMNSNKINISWGLIKVFRSWFQIDNSMRYLLPDIDHIRQFRRYFRSRERRQFKKVMRPKTLRSSLMSIPETISEYRMFIDPQLRQASRVFQGSSSKVAAVLSMAVGFKSNFVALSGCAMAMVFFHQHHGLFESLDYDSGDILYFLHSFANRIPILGQQVWAILGFVVFYAWYKLFKLHRRMGQNEVRLPSASTGS